MSQARVSNLHDFCQPQPLLFAACDDSLTGPAAELDERFTKGRDAGFSVDMVKDYVAALTDRSVQRRLRDPKRKQSFTKVALDNGDGEEFILPTSTMTKGDIIGLEELRTRIFYRRLAAELLGSAILVIFGCGSAMTINPPLAPTVISIAVAFGLTVATVIWCLGGVSGAHINPCVTFAMLMTRKISLTRCVAYVIVQCVGATVGAAVLWGLTPSHRRGTLGVTLVADEITVWQGLAVEIIATFVLVLAIFASCDRLRSDHGGSTALTIGFVVTMDIPWAIQYTGASMNPARSLGPCILTGLWQDHWVFWVGPVVGALAAGLLYEFVFDERRVGAQTGAENLQQVEQVEKVQQVEQVEKVQQVKQVEKVQQVKKVGKLQQVEQVEMKNGVRDHSNIDAHDVERPVDVIHTNNDGPVDVNRKSSGFADDTEIQL